MSTPVSGSLKNVATSAVTSGVTLRFYLRGFTGRGPSGQQPLVPGIGVLAANDNNGNYFVDFTPDGTGAVSGTLFSTRDAAGTGDGEIELGTSKQAVWYDMVVIIGGQESPAISIHAKNGVTLDPSNVSPISTPPAVTAPTGDTTYARLDGSNQPFTSTITIPSTGVYKWSTDTGFSRDSANVIDVGNGTQGDKSGTLQATAFLQQNDVARFNTLGITLGPYPLRWSASGSSGAVDVGISRAALGAIAIGNGTAGDESGNLLLNHIEAYNGNFTAGIGTAPIYAIVTSTAQTASITSTTLYAVPASGAGLYRVSYSLVTTTAGSAGTALVTVGWNNGAASSSSASSTIALQTLGSEVTTTLLLESGASQNITYSTTVSGATGNPQYSLRIRLEYLG